MADTRELQIMMKHVGFFWKQKCVVDCYLSVRLTSCLAELGAVKPVVNATTCKTALCLQPVF